MKVLFLLKSEILNKNITFVCPKLKNMKKTDLFSHNTPQNRHPSSWIHLPKDNDVVNVKWIYNTKQDADGNV